MPNKNKHFERYIQIKNILINKAQYIIMINVRANIQNFMPNILLNT